MQQIKVPPAVETKSFGQVITPSHVFIEDKPLEDDWTKKNHLAFKTFCNVLPEMDLFEFNVTALTIEYHQLVLGDFLLVEAGQLIMIFFNPNMTNSR